VVFIISVVVVVEEEEEEEEEEEGHFVEVDAFPTINREEI